MKFNATRSRRKTILVTSLAIAALGGVVHVYCWVHFACLGRKLGARHDDTVPSARLSHIHLSALTDRQLQFWEDVDEGLDEIENFYRKTGQNIERIRQFAKSAKGESPPPEVSIPGHEPSEEHVNGLSAQPIWNAVERSDLFPWAAKLEANAHIVIEEYERVFSDSNKFASDSVYQNKIMGEGWSAIRMQRLGTWNVENCKQFPNTYELLRSLNIPFAVRGVCFARQAPKSGVKPHSDGRNFILTSHLGLKIPDGCWIEVGGERSRWEQGKLITIDTSFSHSTGNPSDEYRHVLILDYWHPELTEAERSALQFVYDLRNKFESGLVPFRKSNRLKQSESWWESLVRGASGN